MENAITVADNFIVNYLGSSLDEVVTSKVVVSPQKVTAGDNVTFTITGENIVALDVDFEHHVSTLCPITTHPGSVPFEGKYTDEV